MERTPKNLRECSETHPIANSLLLWANSIVNVGKVLAVVFVIVGIISAISTTTQLADMSEMERAMAKAAGVSAFGAIVTWIIYAVATYIIFDAVSRIVEGLAHIVQNTSVTAKVALYIASNNATMSADESNDENAWRCKICYSQNSAEYTYCRNCGESK